MSKYFLAGVANAEIFDGENNLFATAKALTDSSITIGVNSEEVRGGEGAALRGKYFHSSSFGLRMTSAMFEMEYIAANVVLKLLLVGMLLFIKRLNPMVLVKLHFLQLLFLLLAILYMLMLL